MSYLSVTYFQFQLFVRFIAWLTELELANFSETCLEEKLNTGVGWLIFSDTAHESFMLLMRYINLHLLTYLLTYLLTQTLSCHRRMKYIV